MNKILVPPRAPQPLSIWAHLKGLATWENWPYALGLLIVLALIVLLVVMVRRRRKKAAARSLTKEPKPQQRLALKKIWKVFLQGIPREFRRTIGLHQPFIVFGEAGSGKSQLIDNYTDWRGHALEFYPSYASDPQLQIYLGSDVLVQEVPASLLHETTRPVRTALKRVWKPVCRGHEPKVVIVLNGDTLRSESVDALRKLASMMRGKLNVLSSLCGKQVKASIALTYMDRIKGYPELAGFLERNRIPFEITFESGEAPADLEGCLDPYEVHLPRALTSLPEEALKAGRDMSSSMSDYLKIISFFRHSPEFLRPLSIFVKSLLTSDRLSVEPELSRLDLTSTKERGVASGGPFAVSIPAEAVRKFRPMLKHQIAGLIIAVCGFLYMASGYLYEGHTLRQAKNMIREIREIRKAINELKDSAEKTDLSSESGPAHGQNLAESHQRFLEFISQKKEDALRKLLPSFSPHGTFLMEEINQELQATFRNEYLLFTLKHLVGELLTADGSTGDSTSYLAGSLEPSGLSEGVTIREGILYIMALIYASKDNELGKLVKANLSQWADVLAFPDALIETYVDNAGPSDRIDLDISLDSRRYGGIIMPSYDAHKWIIYFKALREATEQDYVSKMHLAELQEGANMALGVVYSFQQHLFLNTIFQKLKDDPRTGLAGDWVKGAKSVPFGEKATGEFLDFVSRKKITYPDVTRMNLEDLFEYVRAIIALHEGSEKTTSFQIAIEKFSFSIEDWGALIDRSSIALLMREFISANEEFDGLLFFRSDAGYDDLVMNPSNDGRLFFTGKGRVDGRFTRRAFEERVKPMLLELPDFLMGLPVSEKDKVSFSRFVFNELGAYTERYVTSFRNYYHQFDMQATTMGELRYVLTQIQQASSPFLEFLISINENTVFDFKEEHTSFLEVFAHDLEEFEFIRRLMTLRKGSYPELDKYRAIMDQLHGDIMNAEAPVPQDKADEASALKACLSPVGRMSLSVFRGDEDSYMNLVSKWLSSTSVGPEWQGPFLGPVRGASLLGVSELKETIRAKWLHLVKSEIIPLRAGFPFDKEAEKDIPVSMIQSALNPQGGFWQGFRDYLAPACQSSHGVWGVRESSLVPLELPAKMLGAVNAMGRLGGYLWDEEGNPKPLRLSVKALPLPRRQKDEPVVVLSFLRVGKSSVFGFNQQPSWETIELQWWTDQVAAVGVEFISSDKSPKSYRSIEVPASHWSFYRLLLEANDVEEHNVWEWTITGPEGEHKPLTVRFLTKEDPWAPFKFAY